MIQLKNLSLRIAAFALRSINLEVERGQYFVILGPSGAGKTKMLEMIAGLERPSSGEIWIADRNITALPPERRNVGFMYQDYLLFPHLTVRRNVGFGLWKTPRPKVKDRIDELSRLLKIEHLLERNVAGLSGGEQQRVALARALAPQPHVLLLDEPLSALDTQNRRALRRELLNVHEQLGTTIIHVTHDFEEALVLADRVAVLSDGEILQVGAPEDVFHKPNSPVVAGFFGTENLFKGEIFYVDSAAPESGEMINAMFKSGPLKLSVIADHEGTGYAVIRPEEITVAREMPHSSALNNFSGVIIEIETVGPLIRLTVDAGLPFIAVLTRQSFSALQLGVGAKAYLSFKAAAIHLF
jgi:ABC-type Fe3+/spermidine/putrescine transport system ATPase subunit